MSEVYNLPVVTHLASERLRITRWKETPNGFIRGAHAIRVPTKVRGGHAQRYTRSGQLDMPDAPGLFIEFDEVKARPYPR